MVVRSLSLQRFRNFVSLRQEFSPALNLFIGSNAQGKTNLLEAIYLLATSKSMRGSRDEELIQWDTPTAIAAAEVLRERTNDIDLEVSLSRTAPKLLMVNTVRSHRAMEFIGQLKVAAFCGADLDLVRGEPSRRRRFLDLEISQLSPAYCQALGTYRRVVEQRSGLLKNMRERSNRAALEDHLEVWTEQLITYGSRLIERRAHFIQRLNELAHGIHEALTEGRERLTVGYAASVKGAGDVGAIQESFRKALSQVREEELRRQVCLLGPHRDDVLLLVNGREARIYASQGQQRTVALSIRLAELELMRELTGEAPVCILDDVCSELDERRRAHVFEATLDRCQTFVSTTELESLPRGIRTHALVLNICGGTVHQEAE